MGKWIDDIRIEGDRKIIKKYEEPKEDVLDKIRAEIDRQYKWLINTKYTIRDVDIAFDSIFRIINKYKTESEK